MSTKLTHFNKQIFYFLNKWASLADTINTVWATEVREYPNFTLRVSVTLL